MIQSYNFGDIVRILPFDEIPDFEHKGDYYCFGISKEAVDECSNCWSCEIECIYGEYNGYAAYRLKGMRFKWHELMLSLVCADDSDELNESFSGAVEILL